ncbi:MAG: hypothetical protein IJD22_06720, partial [Clostridia bacterium]|nr:hypothetical protein [Clostridia bacterium]
LYIFTNDITMNEQAWANCVFFNDTVAKKYGVYEELGVDNFYDMVNDGNWTLDAFLTAIQLVSDDVNDSGVIDTDEVWGITDISGTGEVYGFGAGVTLATAEHTGYSLNYYTDTSAGIAKDIYEIMSNSSYTKNITDFQYDTFASYAAIGSGHSLFMTGAPFLAEMIGDSDNSLGILPLPKYDNNQNEYICSVDCLASVFAVPAKSNMSVSTAGPERTGVILESMAYISSYQLLPKYREVTAALINDEDTENIIDMLKLMKSSAHYDLIYMLGSMDIWGGGLGTITSSYSAMFTSPNAAGSTYRRNTLKMETALDEFFNSVMSLEG